MISDYLWELWHLTTELAPWLFLGAAIAAGLKALLPEGLISKQLGQSKIKGVFKSVLMGIPLPLCSCGVLPAAIGMKKEGASDAATTGFLISTPQTGVDSILVTASFLGWPLALFKVLAAFVTGAMGGLLVHFLGKEGQRATINSAAPEVHEHACCSPAPKTKHKRLGIRKTLSYEIDELIGGIYRYILLGLLLGALITVAVPPDYFGHLPLFSGVLGIVLVLLIAVPLYVCTTASLPIAASLIHAGMPVGAALVFLMAGPATNIATMGAIHKAFGRLVTVTYLGTVVLGSLAFGIVFQSVFTREAVLPAIPAYGEPSLIAQALGHAAAILLTVLVLRWALLDLRRGLRRFEREQSRTTQVHVCTGTSCALSCHKDTSVREIYNAYEDTR